MNLVSRRAAVTGCIVVCLLAAATHAIMASRRPADIDEGGYLAAVSFVEHGQSLYYDFPSWQMPGTVVLSRLATAVNPHRTLPAARIPYVLLGTMALLLFALWSLKRLERPAAALVAVILVAACEIWIAWIPTVKTHAPTALLLLASVMTAEESTRNGRRSLRLAFLSGLLWSATVSFRIMVLPAVVWMGVWLLLRGGWRSVLTFVVGGIAGILPVALYALRDPALFCFHNIGYHAEGRASALIADAPQKAYTVLALLASYQTAAVVLLAILGVVAAWKSRSFLECLRTDEAGTCGVALILTAVFLLPTPTFTQYFLVLTPLLVRLGWRALEQVSAARWVPLGVALYVIAAPVYVRHEWNKYRSEQSELATIDRVAEYLRYDSRVELLDVWGYYVWASDRPSYPRAAGWAAVQLGRVLPAERARQVRAPATDDLLADIRARRIPEVVWSATHVFRERQEEVRAALQEHYRTVFERGGVVVLRPKS